MDLQYEFSESSESEHNTEAVTVPQKRTIQRTNTTTRNKKLRFDDVPPSLDTPQAKSTPKDRGSYALTGRPGETPTSTHLPTSHLKSAPASRHDVEKMLAVFQSKIMEELDVVRMENRRLRKLTDLQGKQIGDLKERIDKLEVSRSQAVTAKPSNEVRASIRQAITHAEEEEGLALQITDRIDSAPNRRVLDHVIRFVQTRDTAINPKEVQEGFKAAVRSRKEKESRERRQKDDIHRINMRKRQRKVKKCYRRLGAIKKMDLNKAMKDKYTQALRVVDLHSSEESEVDEDGNISFVVRPSLHESQQMTELKKLADANRQDTPGARVRAKRRVGPPSIAPPPRVADHNKWTRKFYGMV